MRIKNIFRKDKNSRKFKMRTTGRAGMIYEEDGKKALIDSEMLGDGGYAVFADSIISWETPQGQEQISDKKRKEIIENIKNTIHKVEIVYRWAIDEKELAGNWITDGDEIISDVTTERIEWIIANQFMQIAVSKEYGAWETLFRDRKSEKYWERTYPQSHLHGGGPPMLRRIPKAEAMAKYLNR